MAVEGERTAKETAPKQLSRGWLYSRVLVLGSKIGYRLGISMSIVLSIFVGYQLINYLAKAQQKTASLVGAFYGVRVMGSGQLIPEMVSIPAGSFKMGSDEGEADELPIHKINVDAFELGRFEVTNAQWKAYCDAQKKDYPINAKIGNDYFLDKPNNPVVNVSWEEAQDYCRWLTTITGHTYRLPTEAEWEYAAQGSKIGCYSDIQPKRNPGTAVVGSYSPNSFGLYDMLGNAWEWCEDWYMNEYYASSPEKNPRGPSVGHFRVHRGASWNVREAFRLRCANRGAMPPDSFWPNIGFRCARDVKEAV